MSDINKIEHAVLAKLLKGDYPLLEQLRSQYRRCRVKRRELTGVGFYTYFEVGSTEVVNDAKLRFGDVVAEIEGIAHGAGFVLYVEQGALHLLEGYTYDEPWPRSITEFTLKYSAGYQRDWAALEKVIGRARVSGNVATDKNCSNEQKESEQ